jgi:hypothetical protein
LKLTLNNGETKQAIIKGVVEECIGENASVTRQKSLAMQTKEIMVSTQKMTFRLVIVGVLYRSIPARILEPERLSSLGVPFSLTKRVPFC